MRICIVLPNLEPGGAERLHLTLAREWLSYGIDVDFVLLRAAGRLLPLVPAGASVHGLSAPRIRSSILPLSAHLRATRPDATLAAMWPLTVGSICAWHLARRPGRLVVSDHTQLSVAAVRELKVSRRLTSATLRWFYPTASRIVAVSRGVRDDLCALGGLSPSGVDVIYNPAAVAPPTAQVSPDVRATLWGHRRGYNLLSVGTLKPPKDHATLIRAFALLPRELGARLTILGDGPTRSALTRLINELGLDGLVHLPGFVTDPTDWYRTADLFVLSSAWEGFANVIVEALSFGLPVVSTDCRSGPSEILRSGAHGTLVRVGDAHALANAIRDALSTCHDTSALKRRAEDFAPETIAREYLRVLLPNHRDDSRVLS